MRTKVILHIILMMLVLASCDDYDFDEENYVPLHLETTLMDKWHTAIGYAYTGGTVKDKHYTVVGYGSGENIWKAGVILLLFD